MDVSPRRNKIVPQPRESPDVLTLETQTPSKRAKTKKPASNTIAGINTATKRSPSKKPVSKKAPTNQQPSGPRKTADKKVKIDEDTITFYETPKPTKSPALPNKSKVEGGSKSIGTIIFPRNEKHGPLELTIVKKIGAGAYGEVFQVKLKNNQDMLDYFPMSNNYALKKMLDPNLNRAFEYEQTIMNEIQKKYPKCSAHVLCYFDIAVDKNGIYYMLSEMQEGDVKDIYKTVKDQEQRMQIGYDILKQALEGLNEMKKVGLLHRDIKMDNILYSTQKKNGQLRYKLADFGLSCSKNNDKIACGSGIFGTPAYISPKVLIYNFSGKKNEIDDLWDETDDIYSLAAMLYQFVMGKELMSAEAFQVFSALFSTPSSQKYSPEVTEKVDLFTDLLEENYRNASQQLRQLMKKYSKNSKEYHLLQFILTNINPLSKKQTINQSMKTLK